MRSNGPVHLVTVECGLSDRSTSGISMQVSFSRFAVKKGFPTNYMIVHATQELTLIFDVVHRSFRVLYT